MSLVRRAALACAAVVCALASAGAIATAPAIAAPTAHARAAGARAAGAHYAPKGMPGLIPAGRRVAEPSATASGSRPGPSSTPSGGMYYSYAPAITYPKDAAGISGELTVADPWVDSSDPSGHSLGEVAAEQEDSAGDPGSLQIVEIGWTVDRAQYKDGQPHLFVFHWINGRGTCYDACGFVQASATVRPGMVLAPGAPHQFAIEHFSGGWWAGFDGQWIGYFPDALWSSQAATFTSTNLAQWFGEVASNSPSNTCTQMGNGVLPDQGGAASMTGLQILNADGTRTAPQLGSNVSDPTWYNIDLASGSWGGPGACPDTLLHSGPKPLSNVAQPTFTYSSDEASASFQCAIDPPAGAFVACPGGTYTAPPLLSGRHVFEVRAIDARGAVDPTPTQMAFTVDTVAPKLRFRHRPARIGRSRNVRVVYSSSERSSFRCRLDRRKAASCSKTIRYRRLAQGKHHFAVTATDQAGNRATLTAAFTVDTRPVKLSRALTGLHRPHRIVARLRLRCDRACRVSYRAAVRVHFRRRTTGLKCGHGHKALDARARYAPVVRLSRATARRLSKALRHHARTFVVVTVSVTDRAGVTRRHTLRMRLRRV